MLTSDYNLSKVANLQKVVILNNNDIAQVIRPIYLLINILDKQYSQIIPRIHTVGFFIDYFLPIDL
nr:hypothetical protein [cyanobacterium endosymbiont of Epithemia turgida]